jgi:23S rRNA (uracil1939-C5)-methyltransferase
LYTINPKWNDSLNDLSRYISEKGIVEKLEHFSFKIGPKSFSDEYCTSRAFISTVRACGAQWRRNCYDLYCGTGALHFSNRKKVIGIELIPEAIGDAKENALLNHIDQAAFLQVT